MHIMHFKTMLPVSKFMKFYRYSEDTGGLLYKQYHRLTPTGTYLNCGINFRVILEFIVSKKLYLCVCRCTNIIKGILMESFYYSSSQYMKLKQVVDLRPTNYKAGITRNGEYLRVLS